MTTADRFSDARTYIKKLDLESGTHRCLRICLFCGWQANVILSLLEDHYTQRHEGKLRK
jgi:hypothetical protein